jgi:hypothetical protein
MPSLPNNGRLATSRRATGFRVAREETAHRDAIIDEDGELGAASARQKALRND